MTTEEQIAMLEAKTRELVERNRKLANQIVGYGDRMQETIGGIIRDAKAEALREAADALEGGLATRGIPRNLYEYRAWLRTRADNLEKS